MTRFPLASILALALGLSLLSASPADAAHRAKHSAKPSETTTIVVTGRLGRLIGLSDKAALRAAWVQYGPDGVVEARAVVEGNECPEIAIDLHRSVMTIRTTGDDKFLTVCSAPIPAQAKQAALVFLKQHAPLPPLSEGNAAWRDWMEKEYGIPVPGPQATEIDREMWRDQIAAKVRYDLVPLPLSVPDPQRIVVFGDTGCRIKGSTVQDCSDPAAWPFATIAAEAAKLKPDLVLHVGDYLYREDACPADFKGCAGTPHGDNWPTWDADFFAPARPLLAAAPWIMVRGNHEECRRAGPGWLRLLGPNAYDRAAACAVHLAPYAVPLGAMSMIVMDNADADDTSVTQASLPLYRNELAALAQAKLPVWLALHRPIWAATEGPLGMPVGGNLTMITAAGREGITAPVELMLAGHIHTFEAINYALVPHVPPQIVAGFGGDLLDETPANLHGTIFQGDSGVRVSEGLSIGGFGFLLMTRQGDVWMIDVHDWQGRIERQCVFRAGRLACPKPR